MPTPGRVGVANFGAALQFNATASSFNAATGSSTGRGWYWNSTDDRPHVYSSFASVDFAPASYAPNLVGLGLQPVLVPSVGLGGTQTATLDAQATNSAGTMTLIGTATGTASAVVVSLEFNTTTWATTPHCVMSPQNATARALSTTQQLYIDAASLTTSLLNVKTGSSALPAGTYIYSYVCVQ